MLILFAQEMMGLVSTPRRSSYGQPWGDEQICMSSYEVRRHHTLYPGMGQGPNVSPRHHISQWEDCITIIGPIRSREIRSWSHWWIPNCHHSRWWQRQRHEHLYQESLKIREKNFLWNQCCKIRFEKWCQISHCCVVRGPLRWNIARVRCHWDHGDLMCSGDSGIQWFLAAEGVERWEARRWAAADLNEWQEMVRDN